jgi:hypothetical protein
MTHWQQGKSLSRNRKLRWEKRLRQLAQMRAEKERKRLANATEREPQMKRWHRYEYAVRDKQTGDTAWADIVSVRNASKAISLILKHY